MAERRQPCIVVDTALGSALEIGHYDDTPRAGVLLSGDAATVFENRRRARRAIHRSAQYAKRMDFDWGCEHYRVVNLLPLGARPLPAGIR